MNLRFVAAILASLLLTIVLSTLGATRTTTALLILATMVAAATSVFARLGRSLPKGLSFALVAWVLVELYGLLVEQWNLYRYFGFTSAYLLDWHEQWRRARGIGGLFYLPGLILPEIAFIALAAVSYLWNGMPGRRWRALAIMAAYVHIAATLLYVAPKKPGIDVWHLQQRSCSALLEGRNPYQVEYEYASFVPAELTHDGKTVAFPYLPLQVLFDLPGYWLGGDVRWSLLPAVMGSVWLAIAAARRLGLPGGDPVELAVIAFLCAPRGMMVIELSWTEPLAALCASLAAWCAAGRRQRGLGIALGLLLGAKQYAFLLVPGFWPGQRAAYRKLIVAVAVFIGVIAPFALSAPADFWRGVVTLHLRSLFRPDSISIPAWLYEKTGFVLPEWVALLMTGAVLLAAISRSDGTLCQSILTGALALLTLFAWGKAAHINYYWLVGYLLCLGSALAAAEGLKNPQISAQVISPPGRSLDPS